MDNGGNERRMTDGIIQELFNPIINILNSRMARITYSPKEVENIIKGLKKELIEKIKQNPTVDYNNGCGCFGCKFIDYMIGDNQE